MPTIDKSEQKSCEFFLNYFNFYNVFINLKIFPNKIFAKYADRRLQKTTQCLQT